MNEREIITHMVTELDFYASEYQNYTDADIKESIEKDFNAHVRSYNALLRNIYRKVTYISFTRKIETYIEQRKKGVWDKVEGV